MAKRIPSLLLILLFSFSVFGKSVDRKQASQVARNFYYERINISNNIKYENINIISDYTEKDAGIPMYYVFNFNSGGFVMVSAEDAVIPVLGYSFEGSYTHDNFPVQFIDWIENIKEQIIYHRERNSEKTSAILADWERLSSADHNHLITYKGAKTVEPLLVSTWDQGTFYNELCPADPTGPGGKVWAGCVATAMAQVMFYYRFPESGIGSHGYNSDYGFLSVNFGNTTYKWNEMLTSTAASNLAIATLIYHCGVAVDMMYSPNGSGAYSEDAANAMINNFRYSPNTHLEHKDNYSDPDWADLLRNQLDAKKPMYYHGFGSGGHAFNVDGYQPGDYFHFNWGWSGSYNGYFYLNNLNPGGNNFTYGQGAIVNIYPTGNYPINCSGSTTYTGKSGTVDDGSAPLNYQSNADCYFLIDPTVSPDDSIINIKFNFHRFDTEAGHDTLTFYDGPTTAYPILGSFSGNNLPPLFYSTNNKVLVHFVSDASNNHEGFLFSYQSQLPDYCSGISMYTDQSGTIEDGSGSKHYNNKTVCQYLIQPHTPGNVTLIFNEFQTEPVNDFVEVYAYDTLTQQGTLLGHFSGNTLPPALTSTSGALFIIFFANMSINADGWKATYAVTPVGISNTEIHQDIALFPNPARQSFKVLINRADPGAVSIELLNLTGQVVYAEDLGVISGHFEHSINTDSFGKGCYVVRFISKEGMQVSRLMIE